MIALAPLWNSFLDVGPFANPYDGLSKLRFFPGEAEGEMSNKHI